MSGRVEHKSRTTGRSTERHSRKKKSKKRSSSSSDHCVTVAGQRNACGKDKRQKSRKKKRRRSYSSDSSSSESSWLRLKLETKSKQLLGERPEFSRNASRVYDAGVPRDSQGRSLFASRSREQKNGTVPRSQLGMMERRVLNASDAKAGKESSRRRSHSSQTAKKSSKSRKRKRSLSRSSSSSDSSSSESSSSSASSSGSSSSSVASSQERRRKKRRKKKRLAKKIERREEKKRREERRKLKKIIKMKSAVPVVQEMKRQMMKAPEDRLLKAINVELADRARAMAPMTREEWEKKQSVVRRVFDEVTGRQRLIKGDGEVLEEIVSRDRHMAINKKATKGDGEFFQSRLSLKK